jgi:hypothetical protein
MPYTEEGVKKVNNLTKKGYEYGGGDFDEHERYWMIFAKSYGWSPDIVPKWKKECVCGQELKRNCWVFKKVDGKMTNMCKVIGSECINKFIDKRRTCHICGEEHRNRIVNRCNDCRVGRCDDCGIDIKSQYKKCWGCK